MISVGLRLRRVALPATSVGTPRPSEAGAVTISVEEVRFRAKYTVRADGCWQWSAGLSSNGYAAFWLDGAMRGAHRYSWSLLNGPVPIGLELDHLCRNRACVNPAHLEPVTRAENTRRGIGPALAAQRQAAVTSCPQGHPYSTDNTLIYGNCRSCRTCNRESASRYRARRRGQKVPL